MQQRQAVIELTEEQFQQVVSRLSSVEKTDLGSVTIHRASHPLVGECALVFAVDSGKGALICSPEYQPAAESLVGLVSSS